MSHINSKVTRRDFIKISAFTALTLSGCGEDLFGLSDLKFTPFSKPLAIPPEINGVLTNSRLLYKLSVQDGVSSFFDNTTTATRGINGALLGPTIRVKNGDDIDFEVTNNLSEVFALHWHGMHLPPDMDGGPHQEIAIGGTWTASFTIKQQACTNWYHPHTHNKTATQVYDGIAGFLIVDDNESLALDIPKSYGVDDFPIVVQDRRFNNNAELDYTLSMRDKMSGIMGEIILVNGVINPYVDVENKEVRFRLLNGSNARTYNFVFLNNKSFKQIATDNSFLESPISLNSIILSPGERAEIVVDFSSNLGESFILKDLNSGFNIFKIDVSISASKTTLTPNTLTSLSIPDYTKAVKTRSFVLSMSRMNVYINDKQMDMNVINETINVDDIEIWEITNSSGMRHNFHTHASHFYIIERNGSTPPNSEKGLKDTVRLEAGDSVKVVIQMSDYTDNTNPYMYHCHILEHEDAGMMGQFLVV